MNRTLETLARAIFKSWFVDFDPVTAKAASRQPIGMNVETSVLFPNTFEDSALGPIPKGWKVDELRTRASRVQYGMTTSATDNPAGPRFLRITDIQGGTVDWNTVPYCEVTEEEHAKYRVYDGDNVVARTGASTGENFYVVDPPDAVFASYLVRVNHSEKETSRLVGAFLRTDEYSEYIAGDLSGSAQPNGNAQVLTGVKFCFPTHAIANAFFELMKPLDSEKSLRSRQNATLAILRDALLPRLLSGELRVKDAEKQMEEIA